MTNRQSPPDAAPDQAAIKNRRLPSIDLKGRAAIWALRVIGGGALMFCAEIIMWNNPTARLWYEWPILAVLYIALSALLLDFTVRFQAAEPSNLLLVAGAYALIHSAVMNPYALQELPLGFIVRGLGLQTAAAFYALMLFVSVLRGKQPNAWQVLGASAVGLLWGVWVHWYPLSSESAKAWDKLPLETAQLIAVIGLVLLGLLFYGLGAGMRVVKEKQFELLWWEQIAVVVPLFTALLVGMAFNQIPFLPIIVLGAIGSFVGWALYYQRPDFEPSILAHITFAAPNMVTFVVLSILFLAGGGIGYQLINTGSQSVLGWLMYYLVLGFGGLWLPSASVLIFLTYLSKRNDPKRK